MKRPRLVVSGLSGHVYVITRYRELQGGRIIVASGPKLDVTEDFPQAVRDWRRVQRRRRRRAHAS